MLLAVPKGKPVLPAFIPSRSAKKHMVKCVALPVCCCFFCVFLAVSLWWCWLSWCAAPLACVSAQGARTEQNKQNNTLYNLRGHCVWPFLGVFEVPVLSFIHSYSFNYHFRGDAWWIADTVATKAWWPFSASWWWTIGSSLLGASCKWRRRFLPSSLSPSLWPGQEPTDNGTMFSLEGFWRNCCVFFLSFLDPNFSSKLRWSLTLWFSTSS